MTYAEHYLFQQVYSSPVSLYSSLLYQGDAGTAPEVPLAPIIARQGDENDKVYELLRPLHAMIYMIKTPSMFDSVER